MPHSGGNLKLLVGGGISISDPQTAQVPYAVFNAFSFTRSTQRDQLPA